MKSSTAINPADGSSIGSFPLNDAADAAAAIAAARAAQASWAALPWRERSAAIGRVQRLLAERAEGVARTITANNGKTLVEAVSTEVLPALMAVDWYRAHGKRFCAPRRAPGGSILTVNKASRIAQRPWGVVGIISPWNYPFAIPFSEVVMALLAGNAVVLKVASISLAVGEALASLFRDAGLPAGVFSYLNLPGRQAGDALIDGGIDKLFFTGSSEVGRELARRGADRLLPMVLELGGNDAAIVCADADIGRAAGGLTWAAFSNAGQSCGGAQRILVERSAYGPFVSELKRRVEALRPGRGDEEGVDLGCMTSREQQERVAAQVRECVRAGATVVARSPLSPEQEGGCWLPALVLADVKPSMPVWKDEVFGPVACVVPFDSLDEAVALANDSEMALTASVWTRSNRKGRELALRVRAGAVMVNDHLMSHGLAETPWGGPGLSGTGRTHGELGFMEMLRPQVVIEDRFRRARHGTHWQPYGPGLFASFLGVIRFGWGRSPFARIAGLGGVLRILGRYRERH